MLKGEQKMGMFYEWVEASKKASAEVMAKMIDDAFNAGRNSVYAEMEKEKEEKPSAEEIKAAYKSGYKDGKNKTIATICDWIEYLPTGIALAGMIREKFL